MRILITIALLVLTLLGVAQQPADSLRVAAPKPVDSAALARAQAAAQVRDSLRQVAVRDSLRTVAVRDSLRAQSMVQFRKLVDSSRYNRHPYLRFTAPVVRISQVRQWEGKEGFFYGIVALIFFFGLLRNAFARYLADLFRTYFRTTIRQKVIKEQVANAPLPSLLFNLLFLLIGSLLAVLLLRRYDFGNRLPVWQLFLYSLVGLAAIYFVKFLVLKLFGWLLRASEATDTYIFIVFTTNKVLGILLLPVVLGLAFTSGGLYEASFALCLVLVGGLFVYRFFLSFVSVQKLVQINLFHFLIYFCGIEIAPLLLINKLLVQFFAQTP